MPGPSGTLSRCAPAITTSLVKPVLVCAMTLRAWMVLVSAESFTVAGPEVSAQRRAVGLGHADHRNLDVGVLAQSAAHVLLDDVVRDDHRDGAALHGGGFLLGERAGATVHQHDRTVDRQAAVVGGIAGRVVIGGTSPADRSPRRAGWRG